MSDFHYIWDGFIAKNKISILKPLNYIKPIPVTIFCTALAYFMTPKILANLGYTNISEGILFAGTLLIGIMLIAGMTVACFNAWFPKIGVTHGNTQQDTQEK